MHHNDTTWASSQYSEEQDLISPFFTAVCHPHFINNIKWELLESSHRALHLKNKNKKNKKQKTKTKNKKTKQNKNQEGAVSSFLFGD